MTPAGATNNSPITVGVRETWGEIDRGCSPLAAQEIQFDGRFLGQRKENRS